MILFRDWEQVVLAISIFCHTALLWHVSRAGFARYFYLKGLLAAEILQSVLLFPFGSGQTRYALIYFLTCPFIWAFLYLVLLEFVRFILVDFPGVSGAVRKLFGTALGAAVVLSAALALPGLQGPTTYKLLMIFIAMQRFVTLALLLFLVLILVILFRLHVPLSPNRKLYILGYSLYFGIGFAVYLLVSELGFKSIQTLNSYLVTASSTVLLAGVFLLRPQGEIAPQIVTYSEREQRDREQLHRQLTELNRVLSRAARR